MNYEHPRIAAVAEQLRQRLSEVGDPSSVVHASELKALYAEIPLLPVDERSAFGQQVNALRAELEGLANTADHRTPANLPPIDVTAPFDSNTPSNRRPQLLDASHGSTHPLTAELKLILDIFYRMGFTAIESRQIDDDYHMFSTLNFPEDHPARDDYDTFMTEQLDSAGKPLIAPAHTSTMQNRILKEYKNSLERGTPIAAVIPGRVFRNEDLDARHEHTFYQLEGIYVDKGIHAGQLIATLRAFLSNYYQREVKVKTQPFYFPFTEPSLEFAASCPFCEEKGCNVCSYGGWIELGGCGMIHPNVLRQADIDADVYTGFAWGFGIERLVMIKYGIEDIRYFESARLDFLRQFP
jgi:phenylalanyl-tRNA synthetase alpha chain